LTTGVEDKIIGAEDQFAAAMFLERSFLLIEVFHT